MKSGILKPESKINPDRLALDKADPRWWIGEGVDDSSVYLTLIMFAESIGLSVREADLRVYDAMISGDKIAVSRNLPTAKKAEYLAHELGHYFAFYDDVGKDLLADPDPVAEKQADQIGRAILSFCKYHIRHSNTLPRLTES